MIVVEPARLNQAADRVASSAQTVGAMCAALSVAARVNPHTDTELLGPLESVRDDLRAAAGDLLAAGATLTPRQGAPSVDMLAELSRTEASRAEALTLLDALRQVLPLAEALDNAHGRSCWGDDLGDLIGKLAAQTVGANCGGRE